jgi:hypothetical protein
MVLMDNDKTVKRHKVKIAMQKPWREAWKILPHSSQKEPTLLVTWIMGF